MKAAIILLISILCLMICGVISFIQFDQSVKNADYSFKVFNGDASKETELNALSKASFDELYLNNKVLKEIIAQDSLLNLVVSNYTIQ